MVKFIYKHPGIIVISDSELIENWRLHDDTAMFVRVA